MRHWAELKTKDGYYFKGWVDDVKHAAPGVGVTFRDGRSTFVPYTALEYLDVVPEGHPSAPTPKP